MSCHATRRVRNAAELTALEQQVTQLTDRQARLVVAETLQQTVDDPPVPKPPGRRGPQPTKGPRQQSPKQRAADPQTVWETVEVDWYGGRQKKMQVVTGTGLWHTPHLAPVSEKLLFDGFPRTFGQVPLLDRLERRMGFLVDCYLEIAVSPEEALARMTARRICPQCGAVYHLKNKPPKVADTCDHDGARLTTRKDDRPEVIAVRQQVYDEHMGPVLDHYEANAFDRFRRVNGEQSFEEVYAETVRTLGFS